MALNINKSVPGAKEFYPLNKLCIGTALSPVGARLLMHVSGLPTLKTSALSPQETFPRNKDLPPLFTPLTIRGVTFANRIFVVSHVTHLGECLFCMHWFDTHLSRDSRTVIISLPLSQAPITQSSSDNGHATDWHLVHIGVRITLSSCAD
jgi:hypothetical protein